ncbi:MAG TPA: hypothetical protein VLC46_01960 [Thermoanaerobaculia bacterium]|nr:hypothetical protein [Thermoanaerobaculia bacterium]
MVTQKNHRTEKEIDELVVSQADDPTAWEEEAVVRPRRWRVNPSRLELAAKFFVLSALHRLGADATLSLGEPDDVDVVIINGRTVTTVQVKTLTGGWRWHVEDIHARENHFILFVAFMNEIRNPHVPPDVLVLGSLTLQNALLRQKETEIRIDTLGSQLKALEAWNQLLAPTPAA